MKRFILGCIFGHDEMATHMLGMLETRRAALFQHGYNKALARRLAEGEAMLTSHADAYHTHRANLESSYRLELD